MRHLLVMVALLSGASLLLPSSAKGQGKIEGMVEKVMKALPESAPVKPQKSRKLLIFSKTAGFRHGSIAIGGKALVMMGDKTGAYTAIHTEDESFFEPEKLKVFDAVFMLNTTGNCLKPKEGGSEREEMLKKSLKEFVEGGKGLAGCHSSTDTYHQWKDYNKMIGGTFVSHPWHQKIPVKNLETKHPINAAFKEMDFEIADEIYMFRDDTAQASERKFLLTMDLSRMDPKDAGKGKRKDGTYPISWCAEFGKGRTFYCSLGHREEIYWNPQILQHYLAGIQFALGDLQADATPGKK